MRLLCCSGSLDGGGSERQLWQLASGVNAASFSPEVYLLYPRGPYLTQLPQRIPVHAFWSEFSEDQFFLPGQIHRQQVQHLSRLIGKRGIEIVYDRTFHMTLITGPASRKTATPRVSVIVSPPSRDFVRSRERFRWIKKWLLARAYRDSLCTVVAVSDSVAEDAAQFFGLVQSKIQTINSPIDIAAVEQAARAEHIPRGPSENVDLRVAVVGRLSAEKSQKSLIEALAALRKVRVGLRVELDIIGDGPDRAELEQLARSLEVDACCRFWGYQQNPYPLISRAELLCIPSVYEGLPNVALEALVLKTPILTTDCSGSLRGLLGQRERGVLVPVGDVRRIASEMLDRVDNPAAWLLRAELGSEWVREHHGLQPWLEKMQQLFEMRVAALRSKA